MKPGDFYVSVTDLFAVLFPGAVCTFIGVEVFDRLKSSIPQDHALAHLLAMSGPAAWLAFGAIAYIAGHFIASLGARLDELYDARRGQHGDSELRKHADGLRFRYTTMVNKQMANDVQAAIASSTAAAEIASKAARNRVENTRAYRSRFAWFVDRFLVHSTWRSETGTADITNAYKLARMTLARKAPALHAEMLRTEADSKFFRSFVVVGVFALIACVLQLGTDIWTLSRFYDWENVQRMLLGVAYLGCVWLVLRLAFARFCDLRLKATEMAFQGMIALAHEGAADVPAGLEKPDDD